MSVVVRARAVRRQLIESASARIGMATVLPLGEPVAFVVGFLRPTLFVSTGLLARPADEVAAVLAHERAHAARLDPLRRLVANVVLAFHLPGIADALERRLGITQEMAADACAADELGDPIRVAETLVSVARARVAHVGRPSACDPRGAAVSERVLELLRETPARPGIPVRAFLGAFATFVVALTGSAEVVHHAIEHVLSLLGA
jgi:beta-lactamase regulating signal transducer with metallopeptidase domain